MIKRCIQVLGVLCVIALGLAACEKEKEEVQKKEVIRPVKVKTIAIGATSEEVNTFSAVARGIYESVLSFRVPGVLQTLTANVGTQVKADQVVATVDDRDYLLQVEDIQSRLKAAEAQLEQLQKGVRSEDLRIIDNRIKALESSVNNVKTEYKRIQQLYAADAASKSQLDAMKTQLDQVQAQLQEAQEERSKATTGGREEEVRAAKANIRSIRSNLSRAKASLEDTRLKIPFQGVISQKHVSNFQQIGAGSPIYTLVDINRIELQISIPEQLIGSVTSGQKVNVAFLNFPGKPFSGKITKVGVTADRQTLSYPVFVEVDNPNHTILPGMTANVILKSDDKGKTFPSLPIHAILEDKVSKVRYVWVYDEATSTVKRREISLGRILGEEIEVFQGLRNQEKVVVAGVHRVKEGMKVKLPK